MNVLSLDTSMTTLSVAVIQSDQNKTVSRVLPLQRRSAVLHSTLQEVLAEADLTAAELTHMVVTRGPGSFTGVRLGLAVAEGLKLAVGLEVRALSTPQALAVSMADAKPIMTVIDAAGGDVFVQNFEQNQPVDEVQVLPVATAANKVPAGAWLVGSGAALVASYCQNNGSVGAFKEADNHAVDPVKMAEYALENGEKTPQLSALYVKPLNYHQVG